MATAVKIKPSPYLQGQIDEYNGIRSGAEKLRSKIAKRPAGQQDPTAEETATLEQLNARGKELHAAIGILHESETRDAQVRAMAASLAGGDDDDATDGDATDGDAGDAPQTRGKGGAQTRQRDPGHYRSVKQGGTHSFFGDMYKSREGDQAASARQAEHMRFLDTAGEGVGVIAPKWLTDEFIEIARQGRALASAVRNIPLGDDPRPMTLPKQTAGTDSQVATQANEGDAVGSTDAWDSDVDTVTPKPIAGSQIVTRQLLDMSTPAIDVLIYGDLIGAYNDNVEAKVCAAIAAVGTALSAEEGSTPVTDPAHYNRVAVQAAMAVRQARKRAPDIYTMSNIRYGDVLGLVDTTGRPLVPDASAGPMNVAGVGSVQVDGRWHGMGVIPTAGFTQDDRFWAVYLADVLLFEGNMLRFRYEQPLGPEKVRLGIWAYAATLVRRGTASVKRVEVVDES